MAGDPSARLVFSNFVFDLARGQSDRGPIPINRGLGFVHAGPPLVIDVRCGLLRRRSLGAAPLWTIFPLVPVPRFRAPRASGRPPSEPLPSTRQADAASLPGSRGYPFPPTHHGRRAPHRSSPARRGSFWSPSIAIDLCRSALSCVAVTQRVNLSRETSATTEFSVRSVTEISQPSGGSSRRGIPRSHLCHQPDCKTKF